MGINNKQRRKAKKLHREHRQHRERPTERTRPGPGADQHQPPPVSEVELVRTGVLLAAQAFRFDPEPTFENAFGRLCWLRERVGYGAVEEAVTYWVDLALDRLWNEGWQPGDVTRAVGRKVGAEPVATVTAHVLASAFRRPEASADRRWAAQLEALRAEAGAGPPTGGANAWERRLRAAVRAVSLLLYLPPLPRLGSSSPAAGGGAATALLERVRALLAKAESTPFAEEAEAFTQKAHELMARHAIDEAMLASRHHNDGAVVVGWRIAVDDPYAGPKSLLLDAVAAANRCRSVFSPDLGMATVFGMESDLEIVELLFTSLLVQATEAMMRAGRLADRQGRSRTRSFRQSFLVAYARRIGERLESATREAVAEGTQRHGEGLLPVLASREQAVNEAVNRTFPALVHKGVAINNAAGYVAGRAAAELASLAVGEALPEAASG